MSLIQKATGSPTKSLPGSTATRLRSPDENVIKDARAVLQAMTPEMLLQEARALGLDVTATASDKVRIRGPLGTEGLARLLVARKGELLPLLTAPGSAGAPSPTDFEKELARLLARLDRVEAIGHPPLTQPQRNVLSVIRQQLRDYAAQRAVALWDCEAWLTSLLRERWRIYEA